MSVADLLTPIEKIGAPVPTTGLRIPGLIYADDLVLLTDTEDRLRDLLNYLAEWSYTWGMKVNPQKCGVIRCRSSGPRFRIGRRQRNLQRPVRIHMPTWDGGTY